ncbi:LbFV_orf87-like [Cotesia congregata filamentous virus 1]|uniref:LbFV_orf87-like n=1 Tax=Cotesia congregata filamentous virus 1 TaxID=3064291 RepID=A0ABC8QJN8_9VIRU|nr:LbFV_orf87-like [Cotesia congregata filamentous virus 1]
MSFLATLIQDISKKHELRIFKEENQSAAPPEKKARRTPTTLNLIGGGGGGDYLSVGQFFQIIINYYCSSRVRDVEYVKRLYSMRLSDSMTLFEFYINNKEPIKRIVLCDRATRVPWNLLRNIHKYSIFLAISYFDDIHEYTEDIRSRALNWKQWQRKKNRVYNVELEEYCASHLSDKQKKTPFKPNLFKIQFIRLIYKHCDKDKVLFLDLLNDQNNGEDFANNYNKAEEFLEAAAACGV